MSNTSAAPASSPDVAVTITFGIESSWKSELTRWRNYCVQIDGEDFEIVDVNSEGLLIKHWDEEAGEGRGELLKRRWNDLENIHIY